VVPFYRNVFTTVPKSKVKEVAVMLKAIHAQEARPEAEEKLQAVGSPKLEPAAYLDDGVLFGHAGHRGEIDSRVQVGFTRRLHHDHVGAPLPRAEAW